MLANKFEKYEIQTIKRSQVQGADYNPRKISESARKKLQKSIKTHGMVMPIVFNKQTKNIVGGHQRLDILDTLHKGQEYELTVAVVDLSTEEEIKLNIILNNPSIQGEWDNDLLVDIKSQFPEIDFIVDLGFEQFDLDYMFAETDNFEQVSNLFKETEEQKQVIADLDKIKQAKKEYRDKVKNQNQDGITYQVENDDYYVVLVFNNNSEKRKFMRDIKKPEKEKFIKASILYDLINKKYTI